jgi:putative endonuclease
VGVTSDLDRRTYQHQHGITPGFASRYNIDRLVYYEITADPLAAIGREKEIKAWVRAKKIALIGSMNPQWNDLSVDWQRADV